MKVRRRARILALQALYEIDSTHHPVGTVLEQRLIEDPLPAGLEIVNPSLAVSQNPPPEDPSSRPYGWWWWGTWYEHQNMRDDRAEAFTSLLWDGVYQYTYIARATTPGVFVRPPAHAEEMYNPAVQGRSDGGVFTVTPKPQ